MIARPTGYKCNQSPAPEAPEFSTPPEFAKRYRVDVGQVHTWIRSGELVAVNLAAKIGGRPRWKIAESAIQEFILRRQSRPPAPAQRRRPKPVIEGLIEYV